MVTEWWLNTYILLCLSFFSLAKWWLNYGSSAPNLRKLAAVHQLVRDAGVHLNKYEFDLDLLISMFSSAVI